MWSALKHHTSAGGTDTLYFYKYFFATVQRSINSLFLDAPFDHLRNWKPCRADQIQYPQPTVADQTHVPELNILTLSKEGCPRTRRSSEFRMG